jgi:hypothetical protein
MDPHAIAERRSLALHRAIAARLREDPALVARARRNLAEWSSAGALAPYYRDAWTGLLDGPFERLLAVLCEDTERARELRQATPFAGIVPPRERWAIWREAGGGG